MADRTVGAEVVAGSLDDGAFSVSYRRTGRLVGLLSVGRPDDLAAARQELAGA